MPLPTLHQPDTAEEEVSSDLRRCRRRAGSHASRESLGSLMARMSRGVTLSRDFRGYGDPSSVFIDDTGSYLGSFPTQRCIPSLRVLIRLAVLSGSWFWTHFRLYSICIEAVTGPEQARSGRGPQVDGQAGDSPDFFRDVSNDLTLIVNLKAALRGIKLPAYATLIG
ncbi:hypothetical protein DUI87_08669 [Hirundo rustica rustica]|uniref:Uncharacterized protein n=1 Tax=Hirundo rustica rustica TaxID=333673 RepID=A0A3M0KKH8_HIRRU|nr:hypothetical protein DUI87_08669 [Hirundo rustica rustica]